MNYDIALPRFGAPHNTAAVRASIAGASELPDDARYNVRRTQRSVFFDERARSGSMRGPAGRGTYQSGLFGEEVVADGLRTAGWKLLGHRVKTHVGEVDLIARRGSTIIFAEVKTAGPRRLDVASSVDAKSRTRIRRAAVAWMQSHQREQIGVRHYRFDVFFVERDADGGIVRIDHVRDAF
jgi:putative endonuclease